MNGYRTPARWRRWLWTTFKVYTGQGAPETLSWFLKTISMFSWGGNKSSVNNGHLIRGSKGDGTLAGLHQSTWARWVKWTILSPPMGRCSTWRVQRSKEVVTSRYLNRELNMTYISLFPKVPNPKKLEQYPPISLWNFIYKIISKVMANRLKPWLPKSILEE